MAQPFEEDSFFERQKNKALPETMAEFKASQIATGQLIYTTRCKPGNYQW